MFFCKTGPDPLQNDKATKPEFNVVGPSMAFRYRADDGPIKQVIGSFIPHQ